MDNIIELNKKKCMYCEINESFQKSHDDQIKQLKINFTIATIVMGLFCSRYILWAVPYLNQKLEQGK